MAKERMTRAAQVATIVELSTSISHEVVQPLSAVVANARAALNWLSSGSPNIDRAKSAIEGILRDGMAVGNVIHEMRRLIKQEEPNRSTVQMDDLIVQTLKVLEPDLRDRNIVVSLNLSTALPNTEADAILIQQVLLNLARNASEAVLERASGQREIIIRTLFSDAEITVEVEDGGFGIVTPDRIFEAFFTTKDNGLGVGLSISRSIAEAHGGALVATNLQGRRCLF